MTDLIKVEQNQQGILVVDSRLIAIELGVQHPYLFRTIKKYLPEIEQLGQVCFKNATVINVKGARNTLSYCFLTEPQANFVMTLSRNTKSVVNCKLKLVQSFEKAKQTIKEVIPQQNDRIRELELELQIAQLEKESREIDQAMITLHGKETVLALRGKEDQLIEVKVPTLEVIDNRCNKKYEGMSLVQLKDLLNKRYGFKIKTGKEIERLIEKAGARRLLSIVPRSITVSYVPNQHIEEAISLCRQKLMPARQLLLGECV